MQHKLRFTATLKGTRRPSLDVTDKLDEETYLRLYDRYTTTQMSPKDVIADEHGLNRMLDQLAEVGGITRAEMDELYDYAIELK